jgi:hypothetical protein
MSSITISGDVPTIASSAGATHYHNATDKSFDDARRGLRYVLLRLSLLGLTEQDRAELGELARLAFQESDVTAAANQIKNRAAASPLAIAIADIVASSRGSQRMAMLGAVLGAYAALHAVGDGSGSHIFQGVLGAIAGAVALSTSTFAQNALEENLWRKFAATEE